jgi:hypothetical protein
MKDFSSFPKFLNKSSFSTFAPRIKYFQYNPYFIVMDKVKTLERRFEQEKLEKN